ncbi:MAG: hypothetical protein ACRD3W_08185 [Terriglobales bacterium]
MVFSQVALGHAIRLLLGWHVVIGDLSVPLWISWIRLAIAGYLAYEGFRLSKRMRSEVKVFGKRFSTTKRKSGSCQVPNLRQETYRPAFATHSDYQFAEHVRRAFMP